jgi:hypothetical protein
MSGGIRFSESVFWGKAGWCYRAARNGICDVLKSTPEGKASADELSSESHPAQWCEYLDVQNWPAAKKALLFDAIYQCFDHYTEKGPVGWQDPSAFPGFLRAFKELTKIARNADAKNEEA